MIVFFAPTSLMTALISAREGLICHDRDAAIAVKDTELASDGSEPPNASPLSSPVGSSAP
jgi:hypothetical protein